MRFGAHFDLDTFRLLKLSNFYFLLPQVTDLSAYLNVDNDHYGPISSLKFVSGYLAPEWAKPFKIAFLYS